MLLVVRDQESWLVLLFVILSATRLCSVGRQDEKLTVAGETCNNPVARLGVDVPTTEVPPELFFVDGVPPVGFMGKNEVTFVTVGVSDDAVVGRAAVDFAVFVVI